MTTSPLGLLERALSQAAAVVGAAAGADPAAPTPCRSWTVDQLTRHMINDLTQFALAVEGGPATPAPTPALTSPEPDADHATLFHDGVTRLLAAWRAHDPAASVGMAMGTVPAAFAMSLHTTEFAVHAWDLATATGQTPAWDDEVAEAALAFGHASMQPEYRGSEDEDKSFAPEVPAPAGATTYERMAAFFGRDFAAWNQ